MEYDSYGWYKTTNLYEFELSYQGWGRNFDDLLACTQGENMVPLDRDGVAGHQFGIGRYGTLVHGRATTFEPLSYVGISDFVESGGNTLAVIDGLIVLPHLRDQGIGYSSLRKLLQHTSKPAQQAKIGHNGYIAMVPAPHHTMFAKLGFWAIFDVNDQYIMTAPLVQ